jgi:hypothetical protein
MCPKNKIKYYLENIFLQKSNIPFPWWHEKSISSRKVFYVTYFVASFQILWVCLMCIATCHQNTKYSNFSVLWKYTYICSKHIICQYCTCDLMFGILKSLDWSRMSIVRIIRITITNARFTFCTYSLTKILHILKWTSPFTQCFIFLFFWFFNLWCCSSGSHPLQYFAKFGDTQNMKIDNLKHSFIL